MRNREIARCAKCSGRLMLEEITERTAYFKILDDGSYSPSPTNVSDDFAYDILCENGCHDTGFRFNPFAGKALRIHEE